ncbi:MULTISPECIES: hypothetical protein [unclassified Nocardiopsis]|uniref:hypothetical protein n=1 Tax=unclassified Nocardiopsis TaxID=2649073 RepID=UPI00135B80BE
MGADHRLAHGVDAAAVAAVGQGADVDAGAQAHAQVPVMGRQEGLGILQDPLQFLQEGADEVGQVLEFGAHHVAVAAVAGEARLLPHREHVGAGEGLLQHLGDQRADELLVAGAGAAEPLHVHREHGAAWRQGGAPADAGQVDLHGSSWGAGPLLGPVGPRSPPRALRSVQW